MAGSSLLRFGGREDPSNPLPWYYNPNIFFRNAADTPEAEPVIPQANEEVYIWSSIQNTSTLSVSGALIQFYVCPPTTAPSPSTSTLIGSSNIDLDPGETVAVPCISPWIPQWINNGHECIICVLTEQPPAPAPTSPVPWLIDSTHVAQHNVDVLPAPAGLASDRPHMASFAAVGLHNSASTQISIRPAPEALLSYALKSLGLRKTYKEDVTKSSRVGLVKDYTCGDPLPKVDALDHKLLIEGLKPNYQLGMHALIQLPGGASKTSAAMFFIEQLDSKNKVIGGVAILALGGKIPKVSHSEMAPPPTIPVSIPYRPYSTMIQSGFMTPDGIFATNLGTQIINAETLNEGSAPLQNVSMYVEGFSDPNISILYSQYSPPGGTALPSPSTFKSYFQADFSRAAPGETRVSFIIQQPDGPSTKKTRILKKIFVIGVTFDTNNKTFSVKIPQGTLQVQLKTVIAPDKLPCHCDDKRPPPPYPILVRSASVNWIPSPPYAGTHGPLPFNDPWWKVASGIAAAIFFILAIIALFKLGGGGGGSGSPETTPGMPGGNGTTIGPGDGYSGTDPTVSCSSCNTVTVTTTNVVAGSLFVAAFVFAWIAAEKDDSDLHDRGQANTVPGEEEYTISELVNMTIDYKDAPSPGTPFQGSIKWDYARSLDSGRVLTYENSYTWQNEHYLGGRTVSINNTHNASNLYTHNAKFPLVIGATFTKVNGKPYIGAELYVFALLRSDTGRERYVELHDDGNGKEIEPNTGNYIGTALRLPAGTWYVLILAQDVNTVREGTEPRLAARTIGGALLTDQFVFGLGDEPCELNHDAIVTVIGWEGEK
ncbi:hypothetical protein MMC24_002700 [Lignoscripta atroalba]|nr:hypothetical protein [Lignoscripta atroalba]